MLLSRTKLQQKTCLMDTPACVYCCQQLSTLPEVCSQLTSWQFVRISAISQCLQVLLCTEGKVEVLCQGKTCIRTPLDIDTALHLQQHQTVSGTWDLVIHKTHAVDDAQICLDASENEREELLGCAVVIKYSDDCHCPALFVINIMSSV